MEIDLIKKNVKYFNNVHLTDLLMVITENQVLCMRMGQIISRVKSVERGGGGWKVEHGRAPTPYPPTPSTQVEKYPIAARKF